MSPQVFSFCVIWCLESGCKCFSQVSVFVCLLFLFVLSDVSGCLLPVALNLLLSELFFCSSCFCFIFRGELWLLLNQCYSLVCPSKWNLSGYRFVLFAVSLFLFSFLLLFLPVFAVVFDFACGRNLQPCYHSDINSSFALWWPAYIAFFVHTSFNDHDFISMSQRLGLMGWLSW